MTEISPAPAQQPQMRILAPTREAFRRISVLADTERQRKATDEQFTEYMLLADTLGKTRDWIPPIIPTMNLRAAEAQIRGEEILEAIEQYEACASTETAEEKLVRYESMLGLLVHPDVDIAMQQATNALQARGFKDIVIIPGGSSVYGGMIIRDFSASEQSSGQDIDMLVQFNPSDNPNLSEVENIIDQAIYGMTSTIYPNKHIDFTLDSHRYFVPSSPSGNHAKVQEKDIWSILWTYHPSATQELFDSIAQCFSLTYPTDYGENVRREVLAVLEDLHRVDPLQWKRAIQGLMAKIIPTEPLVKEKHITDETNSTHALVIQGIDKRLKAVKRTIMEDMLNTTAA